MLGRNTGDEFRKKKKPLANLTNFLSITICIMAIDYKKAAEILNGRQKRKIDNNTYLEQIDEVFVVRLYNTDIIKIYPDNTQVLFSGDHKTVTTKKRINDYSFTSLYEEKGKWYLRYGAEFREGVRVNANGEFIG